MSEPTLPTIVQGVLVMLQAAWLTLGVCTNIRHPGYNKEYIISVLTMELVKENPELYETFAHRRITHPGIHNLVFGVLLLVQISVSCLLWLGGVGLILATTSWVSGGIASTLAVCGVLGFTLIWGSFLVGGEWFLYWASERSPQYTHFFMLLWGVGTLVLLT